MSNDQAQFVWPTTFACTLISDNNIIPNLYSISVSIVPIENSPGDISLGYKRLRYFVDEYLNHSVFICKDNPLVPSLSNINTNLVILPTEPYDYFVGSVLFTKFLVITEKYFHVDVITIDSSVGDHVSYTLLDPNECGLDLDGDHWWNSDSTYTGHGSDTSWGELVDQTAPRFEPRVIKGGKSED